jgi:hypothetical protein
MYLAKQAVAIRKNEPLRKVLEESIIAQAICERPQVNGYRTPEEFLATYKTTQPPQQSVAA